MIGRNARNCCFTLAALLALLAASIDRFAIGQTVTVTGPDGKPHTLSPEEMKAMRRGGGPPPGAQPSPQPGQEVKPEDKDKKKEGDDKKKEGDATIKRPEKPPVPPDPAVFKNVKLDDKGRVPPFNFIGQPWPDVMQWLASLGKCTLYWQELPNDYINLTTDRPYPLEEVRDRINRALQVRGFTSIRSDNELSVFKIEKILPNLIDQVEEEKLYSLRPYDFAKVSFELPPGMDIDKAKDDVKQVLNTTAKVFPLVTSKRLLIMDSVANLRTVSELFNTERLVQTGKIVPKEYFLKYARPQQVIEILYMMCGVDPKGKPAQTDPQAQQQMMQQMQQMQQQGRGAEAAKMMQKDAPKVYLAYNRQRNSVLVNAPPELMKVIEQTIRCLDVPYGDMSTTAQVGATPDNDRKLQRYALQNLDPDKFVATLEEIGGLSPYASFKVDDNNKALFVMAPESDHKKITALLHDFDGAGRHFKVIQLRRLPADGVAGTIYKLMAGQQEKKEENNRRSYYWDFYDSGRNEKKKDTIQGFGVEADIENNRLMVWATDTEIERVQELLIQLGEVPSGKQDARPVRLIEPTAGKVTPELLKQLQDAWSASEGNKLIINLPPEPKPAPAEPKTDEKKDGKDKAKTDTPAAPVKDRSASAGPNGRAVARFVELVTPVPNPANAEPAKQPPTSAATTTKPAGAPTAPAAHSETPAPVTISVTADGQLMISSTDTAALDRMEQMIEKLSPPQKRYKVYQLKYMKAFDMWTNLNIFFKEDLGEKKEKEFLGFFYGPQFGNKEDKSAPGLSKRRKLLIDYDPPSNTILVANASASQTAEVEQLIAEYDKPARSENVDKRATIPIKIKYSRPTIIAAAVKEVYRDLLSSKDKEFDKAGEKGEKHSGSERVTIIDYPSPNMGDDGGDGRPSQLKVGFDGALSLGADDVSGILIVSAQAAIIKDIERMVHELDEQAAPQTTVTVHRVNGLSAEALQKALEKSVGKAWIGSRPEQQPGQTGAEQPEKQPQNEGNKRNGQQSKGEKRN